MRSIIKYFITYPFASNTILVLLFIFGLLGLFSLKATFFPVSPSRIISIQLVYPGASPQEMEEGVVIKIEDNLKGVTGIERVSSVSQENSATITVEVLKGFDTDLVLEDVKNAVDKISSFPTDLEPPVVFKQENLNFAISFALSGDVDLKTLKQYARRVENDLRGVDILSKVNLKGFPEEEIEISLREDDLRAFSLTFQEVAGAVRKANLEITGGKLRGAEEEWLIRGRNKEYYAQDMEGIVVKANNDGSVVRLGQVADVIDRWSENPNRSYYNGEPCVIVEVRNTDDENILDITEAVRNYIEDYNKANSAVKASLVRDGSVVLNQRIDLLINNGLVGALLVLIFLALFLNYRLAFWVALGIPVSFLGMFVVAYFYGLTINVLSLFGMILVIGILVDDGIVISENIFRHHEMGKRPLEAAVAGTMEVLPAVFSAILTTVVAFGAFFFIDGRLGDFAPSMAFVVIATLLFSLVEGAFILPAHVAHSKALREKKENPIQRRMNAVMNWMKDRLYAPWLRFNLKHWYMGIAIPVALFYITIMGIKGGVIQATFFPFIERDNIDVNLTMPAGTNEEITKYWIDHIEQAAWEVNKELKASREDGADVILAVQKDVGPSTYQGKVGIQLLDGEARNMKSFLISNAISKKAGVIPGAESVAYGIATPFGMPISVALLGSDKQALYSAKEDLKNELRKIQALKDITDNDQEGLKEINIKLKDKARLLGLQEQDILAQVRSGFFGAEVQRLQRGIDEVKVWVRYQEASRRSIADLENMRIRLAAGQEYPLKELATLDVERGIVAINHLDGKREIKVEADVADPEASISELNAEVADMILPPILARYPEVEATFEGQSRQNAKTMKSTRIVIPIMLLLMLSIIALTFRSLSQTVAVFILIPLGIIGVGWGHWLYSKPISLFSAFGMIALIGVMVNDSLVLVSAFNNNLKEGKPFDQALYEAGLSRFRPIVLTSVTTVAGLLPLMQNKSFQAQFLVPMAIAIAYGMIIATFSTLIALPVTLKVFNGMKRRILGVWRGESLSATDAEAAVAEMESEREMKEIS